MAEEKQNVTIACNVTGKPHPSITWSKAFSYLSKDKAVVNNGALTIYNVAKNDGGIYMCKAENILGRATDTVQLVVFSPLQFKIRPPQVITPSLGSNVRLTCLAESDLRPTIRWEKEGKLSLPVDTYFFPNGTLLFRDIKKIHEGSYICRATNALSTIKTKVKINSPVKVTSCSVVRKYFSGVSGNYVIDPVGEGGLASFTVYCDMTDKSGVGVTVIGHNSESRTHVKGMAIEVVIHVTFITQERVCLSWQVSLESLHTVNSLSSTNVITLLCLALFMAVHMHGGCHVILLRWRTGAEHLSIVGAHAGWPTHAQTLVMVVTVIRMTMYGVKTAVCWLTRQSFLSNSSGLGILVALLKVITPWENLSVTAQHNTNFQDCASTECRVLQLILRTLWSAKLY